MARGRMLSKDISLDEKVNVLSDDTGRLMFTWMIPHLDVEGRLQGEPGVFKSVVAPRLRISKKRIEKYLNEMENLGLIARYSVNGNDYLFAPNFEKHQKGLRKERESPSKIPPPPPELLRSNSGISPAQVQNKEEIKYREIAEGNTELFYTFKDVFIETYKRSPDDSEIRLFQQMEKDETFYGCSSGLMHKAFKEAFKRNRGLNYAQAVLRDYIQNGLPSDRPNNKIGFRKYRRTTRPGRCPTAEELEEQRRRLRL